MVCGPDTGKGKSLFFSPKSTISTLGSTQPPIQCVPRFLTDSKVGC